MPNEAEQYSRLSWRQNQAARPSRQLTKQVSQVVKRRIALLVFWYVVVPALPFIALIALVIFIAVAACETFPFLKVFTC